LIVLHLILRSLGTLMTSLLCQTSRAYRWLAWLGVALAVAAVLSPGTVTASLLVFQSSPVATPVPPEPTPIPPPPTPTPVPPQQPTATPVQPTPVPPTPAPAPTTAVPPAQPTPTQMQPTQPVPGSLITPMMSPTPLILPALTPTPLLLPPTSTPQPGSGGNQPIVNWVKFWDTIAVTLAYPWLCCGVALLLMVPVVLLFLEIKGRRRPPRPPEPVPEKQSDEE